MPPWSSWSPWKSIITCLPDRSVISRGIWFGDNPITFSTPVFMLQIGLSSIFTNLFAFLLKPFGVGSFFSHMLGAIIIGPTVIGRIPIVGNYIFSYESLYVFETFQNFGTMFFLFLVGLKMNVGMVTRLGRKAWIIGLTATFLPLIIALPVSLIIKKKLTNPNNNKYGQMLPVIALCECQSSFHVVVTLLADLKLLNSEIGHLAMSSSLISNTFSWLALLLITIDPSSTHKFFIKLGAFACLLLIVLFLMKPIVIWMIKRTPEGSNTMKEVHVFIIFLMVLLCALFGQTVGQPVVLGPVILGLFVPTGPPLETTIEDKLESIVSCIMLPAYYVATMGRSKPSFVTSTGFVLVQLNVILAFLGKLVGTVLSAMYSDMSFRDAFTLGIIMGSQGIVDLLHFRRLLVFDLISLEVYCIMTYSAMILGGMTSLLVKHSYQPSKQYCVSKRSLQNLHDPDFRILACLYRESNAPTTIDILEASNPTRDSPMSVYVLHLVELQRVARPLLIAHKRNASHDNSVHYNRSKHIINAFKFFEQNKHNTVSLNSFTAVSPYETMHEEICSLAMDKRAYLIILPFHRQLNADGLLESITPIRNINRNVLKRSPCSVGILIDRGGTNRIMANKSLYSVAIIFLGGADDREVLTYGMRMAERPNTALTVIRFLAASEEEENNNNNFLINTAFTRDKNMDADLIYTFRNKYEGNERVTFREEVVQDGVAIVKAIKWMDYNYDLIMVGRQHRRESPLVKGLTEWNEFPELGFLGDMLATSDAQYQVSVLVVQQQFYISDELFQSPLYTLNLDL